MNNLSTINPATLERFLYWIEERHKMFLKRHRDKQPPPWSDDPVMNTVFFTNPYRENDRVTRWYRANIRQPLYGDPAVFFATVAYRRFNSVQTGRALRNRGLHLKWDTRKAIRAIDQMVADTGQPYLSGAYMIFCPHGRRKVEYLCECNEEVWDKRKEHIKFLDDCDTLQRAWRYLKNFRNLGPFIAYEWVTDLRHTHFLKEATDVDSWCAFGPGAFRGLHRLTIGEPNSKKVHPNALPLATELLAIVRERLSHMPHFEMREIEHSLCEFDKYERVRGGGKPKRWYSPR